MWVLQRATLGIEHNLKKPGTFGLGFWKEMMGAVSVEAGGENGEAGGLVWPLSASTGGGGNCFRLRALRTLGVEVPLSDVGPSSSSSREMMVATAGSPLSTAVLVSEES